MSDCDELKEHLARTLEGRYEITRLLGRGGGYRSQRETIVVKGTKPIVRRYDRVTR